MELLHVDTAELGELAALADELSAELVGSTQPVTSGNTWQPSVVAVNVVSVDAVGVAQALARRMSATAANLAVSSSAYATQDDRAASRIRAALV